MMDERKVLHDRDIREPLFDALEEYYGKVRILEEKTMGKSRADVVMVLPEMLVGIEIKSDADTYARLAAQVKDYDRFYDQNIVVVGSSHALHIEEHVPSYWGIITVEMNGDTMDLYFLRKPSANPKVKLKKKLSILWRPELAKIQEMNGMPKYRDKSKDFVVEKIAEWVGEPTVRRRTKAEIEAAKAAGEITAETAKKIRKRKAAVKPPRIDPEVLNRQISELLFERDYNTIAETLAEYRKKR